MTFDLTYQNWLIYSGEGKDFTVSYNNLRKTNSTYYQETVRAWKLIWEQRQGTIYVMYSGGIDSEYTLAVFQTLKLPVTPVIVKFKGGLNEHDYYYAEKYCQNHDMNPIIIDFDLINFVESGRMLDLAMHCKCQAYQYMSTLECILKLDGTVLMADGDPYLKFNSMKNSWDFIEFERFRGLCDFFKIHNITGSPLILSYTAEMLSSFMLDPWIVKLANNGRPGRLSSFSTRPLIYNNNSNFALEQRPKYGGFENFEKLDIYKEHPVFKEFKNLTAEYCNDIFVDYTEFINQHGLL